MLDPLNISSILKLFDPPGTCWSQWKWGRVTWTTLLLGLEDARNGLDMSRMTLSGGKRKMEGGGAGFCFHKEI